jgi:8-oxo-dGTP diphosphatase
MMNEELSSDARTTGSEVVQVAVAVVEYADRFLVGQRPAGKPLAGLWEFPGGRVEQGESARQAAVRECVEETGISVVVDSEYPHRVQAYPYATIHLRFFACHPDGEPRSPRAPFVWVRRNDLRKLVFPEGNSRLLVELAGE